MLTKVAFGLAIILASASVSVAATHSQLRSGDQIHSTAPAATHPSDECSPRVAFPACSNGQ